MTGRTYRIAGSILLVGALVSRFAELALPAFASLLDSLFVLMLSSTGLASFKVPQRRRSRREQPIELLAVLLLVPSFFEAARHGLLGPSHGVAGRFHDRIRLVVPPAADWGGRRQSRPRRAAGDERVLTRPALAEPGRHHEAGGRRVATTAAEDTRR